MASPEVDSVVVLSETSIRVNFAYPAVDNAALRDPDNYEIDPSLPVLAVSPENIAEPTYVDLTIGEQTTGIDYSVTLLRIKSTSAPSGIWDNWWEFSGESVYGGDDAHLWLPSNQDFEIDDGRCTILAGIRISHLSQPNTQVDQYQVFSKMYYPDSGGSYHLYLEYKDSDPASAGRRLHWGIYRGAFGLQNYYAEHFLYPFEDMIVGGKFRNDNDASYRWLYDRTQSINQYKYFYGSVTDDSSSRVRIGAHGHNDGPDYSSWNFCGRIYWLLWIKGYVVPSADVQKIWDGDLLPHEVCDPDTYPMCYINFQDVVGGTLTPDIQSGPNAPYNFNVFGTPVLGGAPSGDSPQIDSVEVLSPTKIRVHFVYPVLDNGASQNPSNYEISPALTIYSVIPENVAEPTYVDMVIDEQNTGTSYSITLVPISKA